MSKATRTYIIMAGGFVLGLWAILNFGSQLLRAPTDISGKWELQPVAGDRSGPTTSGIAGGKTHEIFVEQSGRHLRVTIDGQPLAMQLVRDEISTNSPGPTKAHLELAGGDVRLILQGPPGGDELLIEGHGLLEGQWRAIRVEATYRRNRQANSTRAQRAADVPGRDHVASATKGSAEPAD